MLLKTTTLSNKPTLFVLAKAALVLGSMPQSSVGLAQHPVCQVRPPVLWNCDEDWEMLRLGQVERHQMSSTSCATAVISNKAIKTNRPQRIVGDGTE